MSPCLSTATARYGIAAKSTGHVSPHGDRCALVYQCTFGVFLSSSSQNQKPTPAAIDLPCDEKHNRTA
jgi:hypothetical protein